MPNHVENDLCLIGPEKHVEALLSFIGAMEDKPKFDFNRLIPYPDPYATMDAEYEAIPDLVGLYPDDPTYAQRVAARQTARKAYAQKWGTEHDGYNAGGYEWCISTWGTKWGAYHVTRRDYDGHIILTFQTAWSPPSDAIMAALHERFPAVTLHLEYFERGVGFCGGATWPAEDDYYPEDEDNDPPWHAGIKTKAWHSEEYRGRRGG